MRRISTSARQLLDERPQCRRAALLADYARRGMLAEAEALFAQMTRRSVFSWNTMQLAYANAGAVDRAIALFGRMPERNVVSWNIAVGALVRSGRIDEARGLFEQMPERNVVSWTTVVAGMAREGKLEDARALFDRMPERNTISWNAMISGYAKAGDIEQAHRLFEEMPERDLSSWNTMIMVFVRAGDMARGLQLFDGMVERNAVTWTTLMAGYVQHGEAEMALRVFHRMLAEGGQPNQGTFVVVLDSVSHLAALRQGQQVHAVVSKTPFQRDTVVESALMNAYAKSGDISASQKIFGLATHRDLISCNGMITALAHHGLGEEALQLFRAMEAQGLHPNGVTYVGVLSACNHSGLVDEGLAVFRAMLACEPAVPVRDDHYTILADLCGRAGRLDEARKLVGAGVERCDAPRKQQPGCSWIEVSSRVHVFVVRDRAFMASLHSCALLHVLHDEMRMTIHGAADSEEDAVKMEALT